MQRNAFHAHLIEQQPRFVCVCVSTVGWKRKWDKRTHLSPLFFSYTPLYLYLSVLWYNMKLNASKISLSMQLKRQGTFWNGEREGKKDRPSNERTFVVAGWRGCDSAWAARGGTRSRRLHLITHRMGRRCPGNGWLRTIIHKAPQKSTKNRRRTDNGEKEKSDGHNLQLVHSKARSSEFEAFGEQRMGEFDGCIWRAWFTFT